MSAGPSSQITEGALVGGRYEVVRLIGKGGMGEVYEARNVNSGRAVALKTIRAEVDQTPEQRRRFLREAKAATAIEHPNVIEVLDVFEEKDGTLVMVMELLRGETLKEHRKKRGALTLHETALLMLPVVEALHVAHEKGIVHRDLKPENVFLAESHSGSTVPRVLDFGIAKVLDPTTINSETQGGGTATGSLLGTPHYMSYEQAMSEKDIDQRSDVWSLGVMVFEALTGRRPIEFENLGEMYTKFLTGKVPAAREVLPDLPEDMATVLDGCLKMQREERLDSLEPLIDVLGRYADPTVPGAGAGGRVVSGVAIPTARASTIGGAASEVDVTATPSPASTAKRFAIGGVAALLLGGLGAYVAISSPATTAQGSAQSASPVASAAPEPSVTVTPTSSSATATADVPASPSTSVASTLPSASASVSARASAPPRPPRPASPRPAADPNPTAEPPPAPDPEPDKPKGLSNEDPYKQ